MFSKKKLKEKYNRGFDEGVKECRAINEEDYKYRTYRLEEWEKRLKKEQDEWEETKARYVLEQLKQIKGG